MLTYQIGYHAFSFEDYFDFLAWRAKDRLIDLIDDWAAEQQAYTRWKVKRYLTSQA